MTRYAVLDDQRTVLNVVIWDGESDWEPPDGCTVYALADDACVEEGDKLGLRGKLTKGPPVVPDAALASAAATVQASLDPDVVDPSQHELNRALATIAQAAIQGGIIPAG